MFTKLTDPQRRVLAIAEHGGAVNGPQLAVAERLAKRGLLTLSARDFDGNVVVPYTVKKWRWIVDAKRVDWCPLCADDPAGQRWLCPNARGVEHLRAVTA